MTLHSTGIMSKKFFGGFGGGPEHTESVPSTKVTDPKPLSKWAEMSGILPSIEQITPLAVVALAIGTLGIESNELNNLAQQNELASLVLNNPNIDVNKLLESRPGCTPALPKAESQPNPEDPIKPGIYAKEVNGAEITAEIQQAVKEAGMGQFDKLMGISAVSEDPAQQPVAFHIGTTKDGHNLVLFSTEKGYIIRPYSVFVTVDEDSQVHYSYSIFEKSKDETVAISFLDFGLDLTDTQVEELNQDQIRELTQEQINNPEKIESVTVENPFDGKPPVEFELGESNKENILVKFLKSLGVQSALAAGNDESQVDPRLGTPTVEPVKPTQEPEVKPSEPPVVEPSQEPQPTPSPEVAPEATEVSKPTTLKEYANELDLDFCVYFEPGSSQGDILMSKEFNCGNIFVGMSFAQPTRGHFEAQTPIDYYSRFAEKNGLNRGIWGAPIIWAADVPDWIKNGNFSKDELTQIMNDHVTQLVTMGKGKVNYWTVVNEPYAPPYRNDDIFYQVIGPDYVELAFRAARIADPNVKLIFNDTYNHMSSGPNGTMTQFTQEHIRKLKEQGLVDGVGLQMHLDAANPPNKEDMIATMQSYGVPIYITEFDVNLSKIPLDQADRLELQAKIAADVLDACLESGVCKSFTVFGLRDKMSVWEKYSNQPNADPLLFDDNFSPKPAYYAMLEIFKKHFERKITQ